jgi:DNA-binding MarR family transcriptional regulator
MYGIVIAVTAAVRAIRAWVRLDEAFGACSADLVRRFGVTGAQLGMLRLLDEWGGALPLAQVRTRLSLHPATVGQLFARLAARGLVVLAPDPADRRRRTVTLTDAGRDLLARAPLVGPVRLRRAPADPAALERLAAAFTEAVELFGLAPYAPTGKD